MSNHEWHFSLSSYMLSKHQWLEKSHVSMEICLMSFGMINIELSVTLVMSSLQSDVKSFIVRGKQFLEKLDGKENIPGNNNDQTYSKFQSNIN